MTRGATETIITTLRKLCKTEVPSSIENFIRGCTSVYGKVKMVIVDDRFYIETPSQSIYETLTNDDKIIEAKTGREGQALLVRSNASALPDNMSVLGREQPALGGLPGTQRAAAAVSTLPAR